MCALHLDTRGNSDSSKGKSRGRGVGGLSSPLIDFGGLVGQSVDVGRGLWPLKSPVGMVPCKLLRILVCL